MDNILVEVAKRSPEAYAETIRQRNTRLLISLMTLEPYIGKLLTEIPDAVMKAAMVDTQWGCPHCTGKGHCRGCVWTKCTPIEHRAPVGYDCTHVLFDGVMLLDVGDIDHSVRVRYNDDDESLEFGSQGTLRAEDFEKCRKFLQAHIDWANVECWGTEI